MEGTAPERVPNDVAAYIGMMEEFDGAVPSD